MLQRGDWVTKLIVRHYHLIGYHIAETNQTLASLPTKYWVFKGREEIRECENECRVCKRINVTAANQVMVPLPAIRLKRPLRVFFKAAVDYGGLFITVQGRGRKRAKMLLCLFTCLLYRAVHLEVAYGMNTDSFLNAF